MDLIKTGKFISQMRKEKELTQVQLAQKIGVSEKTISKWECGNGFPDTSLILPLCKALDISANELLTGKKLSIEEYKTTAEENLLTLKSQQEKATKHLLTLEWVIGGIAVISMLFIILLASYFVESETWKVISIIFSFVMMIIAVIFCLRIEREAGFYACGKCQHKYVPSYKAVLWSMHMGRTRYMKCPKCGQKSWQKKTINGD